MKNPKTDASKKRKRLSLAEAFPEIAAQMVDGDPWKVTPGSNEKFQFRCPKGHLPPPSMVGNKVKLGPNSCSICSGQSVLVGLNDLATTHPEIAAQAYEWDPKTVSAGSTKKARFKCQNNHISPPVCIGKKVQLGVNSCSICSGKTILVGFNDLATTHPEIAAQAHGWDPTTFTAGSCLKKIFRCPKGHFPSPTKIQHKVKLGPKSCAICSGKEVLVGFNDLATTHPEIAAQAHGWDPKAVSAGSEKLFQFKCPIGHLPKPCSIVNKVRYGLKSCSICSGKEVLVGFNDLATTHPEIAAQAHGWDPKAVSAGSNKKLRFKCEKGHLSPPITVGNKVGGGATSCRYCSNVEVLSGFNDLATTHPEIADQAFEWDPKTVTAGSAKKKKWKCKKCNRIWLAPPAARIGGKGCSKCAKYGYTTGKPGYLYLIYRGSQIQYGITNVPEIRIKVKHGNKGWNIVEVIGPISGEFAAQIELSIKRKLKKLGIPTGHRAFRERFDGFTEAFNCQDLFPSSISDLLEKIGLHELKNILNNI